MSMRALAAALDVDLPGQTASPKLVLLLLALWQREETGDCWPSREWLVKKSGLSPNTVHEALATLERFGVISRFPRFEGGGKAHDGIVFHFPQFSGDGVPPILGGTPGQPPISPPQVSGARGGSAGGKPQLSEQETGVSPLRAGASAAASKSLESGGQPTSPTAARDAAVKAIWSGTPTKLRAQIRTGSGSVAKALAAHAATDDPGQVAAGVLGYYAANPDTERWPSQIIADGDWRAEPEAAAAPEDPELAALRLKWDPAQFGGAPDHHFIGTDDDPGPMRQWGWLEGWFGREEGNREHYWPLEQRGPVPGAPGCRVWPGVLAAFVKAKPNLVPRMLAAGSTNR